MKFLYSTFLTLLAILILLSTSSFSINKHYCSGSLVDSTVFTQVEKCVKGSWSSTAKGTSIAQVDCCIDVTDLVEGQEVVSYKRIDNLDYNQQLFLFAFTKSYFNLFERVPSQVVLHRYYTPPILLTNFQVLHQSFLI